MDIRFYNTLTHTLESFEPMDPPVVSMYNCGPTVYDFAHIGNFRAFLFADVLRRFLELAGYDVRQVMNITDVGHMTEDQLADGGGEDKMEKAQQRIKEAKKAGDAHAAAIDNPDDPYQIAAFYTDAFLEDARKLGMKIVDDLEHHPQRMPRATRHVESAMIPMIEKLIERQHAYVAEDGAVYYAIESFPDYGKLSGNTLDKLRGGAGGRIVDEHQKGKRHPADFLLWKPDPSHLMKWDSPWGVGYPGWHIECSAMATKVLGRDRIDIHTGGEDNIFPHHECEIAQTCGATGGERFANFWMHTRYLLVEGEKMSKSKGNFFTVRDVLEGRVTGRAVDPAVLRYELMKSHYRKNADFTRKGLEDSGSAVQRLRDWKASLQRKAGESVVDVSVDHPVLGEFAARLADDLNMAGALAVLFEYMQSEPEDAAEALGVLYQADSVLQVLGASQQEEAKGADDDVTERCEALDAARAAKDFDKADAIRAELIEAGYEIKTTKEGTVATKKLA